MPTAPAWTRDALFWHVYPLGFSGAPVRPVPDERGLTHRLLHVQNWLDHLIRLGLNGLLLGPIFSSSSHGYDTLDYFSIDSRLGDSEDFDSLVAACKQRGVRVLLDGVFNHVGRAHPAFGALEEHGPAAETAGLFSVDWDGWEPGQPVPAEVFEGHDSLVTLDHSAPEVADLVVEVMCHWLERGIDGWRLDAAYAVPPEFWQRVLPRVRAAYPEAFFVGEVIHGDYPEIVTASGMDTVTQYQLWHGIWHGIADRNFFETEHGLERHEAMLATFIPATFVGNHDVTRIASAVTPALVPHTLAVLMTAAGVPAIYAGDELGWEAVKEERLGGDDPVRPYFPVSSPPVTDLDVNPAWQVHRDLIAVRRNHPWLYDAATEVVQVANQSLLLRSTPRNGAGSDGSGGEGGAVVVTALNLAAEPVRLPAAGGTRVLAGAGAGLEGDQVRLSAHGWAVLAS